MKKRSLIRVRLTTHLGQLIVQQKQQSHLCRCWSSGLLLLSVEGIDMLKCGVLNDDLVGVEDVKDRDPNRRRVRNAVKNRMSV